MSAPDGAGIQERALRAGWQSFLVRVIARGLGLVQTLVLARLLVPEDFGIFGVVLFVVSIFDRLSGPGLQAALIQRRATEEELEPYLQTAWSTLAIRGLALGGLLLALAPWIADLISEPRAVGLMRGVALLVLLRSLRSMGLLALRRRLDVSQHIKLEAVSGATELVVACAFALAAPGPWALMIGLLAAESAALVTSYGLHPFRPRFQLDLGRLRELRTVGRWTGLSNAVSLLATRGDAGIIAWTLGTIPLGIYTLGRSAADTVTNEVARVVGQVFFPACARAQDDQELLRAGYLKVLDLLLSLTLPAAAVLAALAPHLVTVVLGEKWRAVETVLPLLALAGVLRAANSAGGAILNGVGRVRWGFFLTTLLNVLTLLGLVWFSLDYGLPGAALAHVVAGACCLPLQAYALRQVVPLGARDYARALAPGLLLGASAGGAALGVGRLTAETPAGLALSSLAAALAWGGGLLVVRWIGPEAGPWLVLRRMMPGRRSGREAAPVASPAAGAPEPDLERGA